MQVHHHDLKRCHSQLESRDYHKRRKATRMVAVVVTVFATSWLPIHIFQLWMRFDDQFPYSEATYIFKIIAHSCSYLNSCINPFVYSFLAEGFRKAIRRGMPRCCKAEHGGQATAARGHKIICANESVRLVHNIMSTQTTAL